MAWLRRLLRWLGSGSTGAPAPPNTPGRQVRRVEDYVGLLDRHPGLRSTTIRVMGGRATDDGTLFAREHVETEDDAGNAVQVDAFDARTCSLGHMFDQTCLAVGVCELGGEVVCSHETCGGGTAAVCQACGACCCPRHRKNYNLGDGRTVTYCINCGWKKYWFF
jgi:hypothetical protein